MRERLSTLPEIEDALWHQLTRATHDRHHEWRTTVLATVYQQDGVPAADARNVVLREVNVAEKRLVVYTDARAAKAAQLRAHPHGSLVMWSSALGWQLRCRVRLGIEDTGLSVSSRWERLKLSPAAQDYLSPLPPGAPLEATPAALSERACFAMITAQVEGIDWLELHPEGHRRAVFDAGGARWVQP